MTIREKEESSSFEFLKGLHKVLDDYPEIEEWLVAIFSAQSSLMEFFKNNPAKEVRKLLALWISELINKLNL